MHKITTATTKSIPEAKLKCELHLRIVHFYI